MAVLTPTAVVVYPRVDGKADKEGKVQYSVTLVIPKSANIAELETLVKETREAKFPKIAEKLLLLPILDGDLKDTDKYPFMADSWVINCKSNFPFTIVNDKKQEILDLKSEIYGGIKGRAVVTAYGYDFKGKKGISFGIQALQKLEDGEKIGGFNAIELFSSTEALDL